MQLTLDRFGRMVLPKAIRDDFTRLCQEETITVSTP